jgi:hypothetical protein
MSVKGHAMHQLVRSESAPRRYLAHQLLVSGRWMCPAHTMARSESAPRSVERKVVTEALSLRCSTTRSSDASIARRRLDEHGAVRA